LDCVDALPEWIVGAPVHDLYELDFIQASHREVKAIRGAIRSKSFFETHDDLVAPSCFIFFLIFISKGTGGVRASLLLAVGGRSLIY